MNPGMTSRSYFDFVDGLRAIAVTSVVAYHVGVPGVTGGFVGVDIFFVISGFLIINQIVAALQSGTFSFSEFWSRRALRILPPYLLVIASSAAAAAYVLVTPSEFEAFGKQALFSAVMVVNHLFLEQQGYFDAASNKKILLHLWSLAVEEQFYLFAPMILAALWWLRLSRTTLAIVGAALATASLVGCINWTPTGSSGIDKNYAFFLMPFGRGNS